VKWGPLIEGDILDRAQLQGALRQYQPKAVMHFAAFADVGESVERPLDYYRNNVAGTLNLLEAMHEEGVNRLVFSSTCATYGIPQIVPIPESHPQNPINPYGTSKRINECMLQDVGASDDLRSISLRYFNAAGADPYGDIGEERHSEGHLIPLVLQVAAGQRSHITIFGTDYNTPDGTCVRDYIHVADLAEAHVLALEVLEKGDAFKCYNLGTGKGFSVREVVDTAISVTRRSIVAHEGPRRAGDPPCLVADPSRARDELGWKPRYNDLSEIIATAWNWNLSRQARRAAQTSNIDQPKVAF